jgi:23S rRNA (pseudouridine1915-N3)-methyltransferase
VAFVVGSDLGLDPGLARTADRVVSLGPLTLPHRIARLVLWEQIFRATSILAGGRYHRLGVQ